MCAEKSRIHFVRPEGGFHRRIWFAKAGKVGRSEFGIAPEPRVHLENGTYSFALANFDPRGVDLKEAQELGKSRSLYPGMGAQFGAQIWRMAHEAQVGDYIFLESENHHLHAVGFIAGPYGFKGGDDSPGKLAKSGLHYLPVHWVELADGHDAIQLGRLDNAVFRNVVEKDELASLLLDLTRKVTPIAWGIAAHEIPTASTTDQEQTSQPEPLLPAGEIKLFVPAGSATPVTRQPKPAKLRTPSPDPESESSRSFSESKPASPVSSGVFKISRNGQVILELTETDLRSGLASGLVRSTDHCWTSGMAGWELVSARFGATASVKPEPIGQPSKSQSGKVLDFNVATSQGVIVEDNGTRFIFHGAEWRSAGALPHSGIAVNFVANGQVATAIYVIPQATLPAGAALAPGMPVGADGGFYRSADRKWVGGVCAGLAHKWGRSPAELRALFVLLCPLLLVYVVMWLVLPERETA